MKAIILKEYRDFFQQHGYIEFEELLNKAKVEQLLLAVENMVSQRLGGDSLRLYRHNPQKIFSVSHDLWRDDPVVKKNNTLKLWAQIIAELNGVKQVRLGFDNIISGPSDFLGEHASLDAISSLKPVGGMILCLRAPSFLHEGDLLPQKEGNATFISPQCSLVDLTAAATDGIYLLITYVDAEAIYYYNRQDPHNHAFKQSGYVFGDRIKNHDCPIIVRSET
ncbi:MAG: hypothetical protein ACQEP8_02320 [Chlamydiota bacterium]